MSQHLATIDNLQTLNSVAAALATVLIMGVVGQLVWWVLKSILRAIKAMFVAFWFGKWVYDNTTKEHHRIVDEDERGLIIDARSHSDRRVEESYYRRNRRREILVCTVLAVSGLWYFHDLLYARPSVVLTLLANKSLPSGVAWVVAFPVGLIALSGAIVVPYAILRELLYLSGFARMKGANVFDPPPPPPMGPDGIFTKDPHGKAGPADIRRIDAVLGGKSGKPATAARWKY